MRFGELFRLLIRLSIINVSIMKTIDSNSGIE